MRNPQASHPLVMLCLVCVALAGCSDDSKGTVGDNSGAVSNSDLPAPDAALVSALKINAAVSNGLSAEGKENAALPDGLFARARLIDVKADLIGGRDLAPGDGLVGQQATINYDIDEDDSNESIFVFVATLDMNAYLIWEDGDRCYLAWEDDLTDEGWLVTGPCLSGEGADDTRDIVICSLSDDTQTCQLCDFGDLRDEDDDVCAACTVSGLEARCSEPVAEPMEEPDAGNSNGVATACDSECMAQDGATCCTTCGCEGEVVCTPPCTDGLLWDCEFQCCFDYEVFECPEAE